LQSQLSLHNLLDIRFRRKKKGKERKEKGEGKEGRIKDLLVCRGGKGRMSYVRFGLLPLFMDGLPSFARGWKGGGGEGKKKEKGERSKKWRKERERLM